MDFALSQRNCLSEGQLVVHSVVLLLVSIQPNPLLAFPILVLILVLLEDRFASQGSVSLFMAFILLVRLLKVSVPTLALILVLSLELE